MPLHDHFRPPLSDARGWESIHADWASTIVHRLNEIHLPERYFAAQRVRLGNEVEVDIGTVESANHNEQEVNGGGIATAIKVWAPPAPPFSSRFQFINTDIFEIQIYYRSGGQKLVAAIELVSPANKDRPSHRLPFVTKCAAYLARGISVVVVDAVTDRHANLHAELVNMMQSPESLFWESPTDLSAVAYRVIGSQEEIRLEFWPFTLTIGAELPTLPLWLAADFAVPLELEYTYCAACAGLRIV